MRRVAIRVRRIPERRQQVEVQVVVGVDETRQKRETAEVENGFTADRLKIGCDRGNNSARNAH